MITLEQREPTSDSGLQRRALRSASLAGSSVPTRVLLAPWGAVESTNGSFIVDDEGARLTVEAFGQHGTDLPIDYEHQTLGGSYASPNGQAPAAGWIKSITAAPGVGLLAEIEWTEQGEKMLMAKEFRYLSPVAIIRKNDRRLVAIHSAALTNKPAIRGMEAIVNRSQSTHETAALDHGAAPAEAARVDDLTWDDAVDPLTALRETLQLDENAGADEVLIAAGRRLAEMRETAKQEYVEQRIAEAIRAGKLVEAQRAWAEALVAKEEGLFDEWLRTAPVIVQPGRSTPPSAGDAAARREQATITRARAEYRTNPLLSRLTSEEAFVACAAREANSEW
jgi:phage I-like protein